MEMIVCANPFLPSDTRYTVSRPVRAGVLGYCHYVPGGKCRTGILASQFKI